MSKLDLKIKVIVFSIILVSCSRYRSFEITDAGKLVRTSSHNVKYKKREGGYELRLKDYYLFYTSSLTDRDSVKLIHYAKLLLQKAEKPRLANVLKPCCIQMTSDTAGSVIFNDKGSRDYVVKFEFNLRSKFIHYQAYSTKF